MVHLISKSSFEDFTIEEAVGWSFDQDHITFTFQHDKAATVQERQKKQTRREVMEQNSFTIFKKKTFFLLM